MSARHLGCNKWDDGIQPKYPLSPNLLLESKIYMYIFVHTFEFVYLIQTEKWEWRNTIKIIQLYLTFPRKLSELWWHMSERNVRSLIMTSVKPPLPWREQIEKSRRIRSSFSWEDFSDHQHKSRLQVFQVSFRSVRIWGEIISFEQNWSLDFEWTQMTSNWPWLH